MLNSSIFYHAITRKIIVGFGSLFSDIRIKREDLSKTAEQTLAVPIAYAPKEKWLARLEQDPTLENHTYTTLPRMSFEITGFSYDAIRKINRNSYITCSDPIDGTVKRTFAPVPYNIDISLYVLTKTTEDGLQIVEQILPFFSPELTMAVKVVPESNIIIDVPVVMNSMSVNDEYDGDFQTRRFVTYTLNFTIKAMMFGPVTNASIINRVFVNTDHANLDAIGNTISGDITNTWNEQ